MICSPRRKWRPRPCGDEQYRPVQGVMNETSPQTFYSVRFWARQFRIVQPKRRLKSVWMSRPAAPDILNTIVTLLIRLIANKHIKSVA